jgi:hypothetical protein
LRLRSPDNRRSPIPLAAQPSLVSANVDILRSTLRSTLRRPAAAGFDVGEEASHSLLNTSIITVNPSLSLRRFSHVARMK